MFVCQFEVLETSYSSLPFCHPLGFFISRPHLTTCYLCASGCQRREKPNASFPPHGHLPHLIKAHVHLPHLFKVFLSPFSFLSFFFLREEISSQKRTRRKTEKLTIFFLLLFSAESPLFFSLCHCAEFAMAEQNLSPWQLLIKFKATTPGSTSSPA